VRTIVSAAAIFVALAGPGAHAQEGPSSSLRGKLSVSPATMAPNSRVTVTGSGCAGATSVGLFPGTRDFSAAARLASIPTRGDGSFSGAIRVPGRIGLGPHTLSAVCGDELIASAKIRVVILGFLELDGAPGTLTVSRSAVLAGKRLRILTTRPCQPGTTSAALDGTRLELVAPAPVADAVRADVTIPRTTPPGVYTLSTRCNGLPSGTATLRVLAAAGRALPASAGGLPVQGINVLLGVIAVLALILIVSIVLSFQRQRTRTTTPGYFDLPSSQRQAK
jgi:hypothetical protein